MKFIATLDTYLQRMIRWCLDKISIILTIVLAIFFIAMIFISPFEYEEGLFDVDGFEIFSMTIFLLLTWRFFKKSHLAGLTKWKALKSYSLVLSLNLLISLASLGGIVLTELEKLGTITSSYFESNHDIDTFIWFIFTTIMLYAFAPLPQKTFSKNINDSESKASNRNTQTEQTEQTEQKDADFDPWGENTKKGNAQ